MAFTPTPDPQNVSITGTPTVTIGSQPIAVSFSTVAVEDTTNYKEDAYNVGSAAFISLSTDIATGSIVEILNFNLISTDANSSHKIEFTLDNGTDIFYTFYTGATFFETLNVQITIPGSSDNDLAFRITETTAGSTNPSVSLLYRITAP